MILKRTSQILSLPKNKRDKTIQQYIKLLKLTKAEYQKLYLGKKNLKKKQKILKKTTIVLVEKKQSKDLQQKNIRKIKYIEVESKGSDFQPKYEDEKESEDEEKAKIKLKKKNKKTSKNKNNGTNGQAKSKKGKKNRIPQ